MNSTHGWILCVFPKARRYLLVGYVGAPSFAVGWWSQLVRGWCERYTDTSVREEGLAPE